MDRSKEKQPGRETMRLRGLWLLLGFLCLVLGCVGIVLPVLPTTPFFLVTLFCFTKSSRRMHDWFLRTDLYKKHLESYVKKEGMTVKTKRGIIGTVTALMAFGFYMMARKGIWVPCAVLGAVWVAHMVYFLFFVKTIPAENKSQNAKQ